jgi:hypothetical protein
MVAKNKISQMLAEEKVHDDLVKSMLEKSIAENY